MTRSYDQFCALAQALDRVGSRWTLLIVRELLVGPARFGGLVDELPGISTNLLADRLRELEADGLVRKRRLPPPASVDVYELTSAGADLAPAVMALATWGARYMLDAEYREPPLRGLVLVGRTYLDPVATAGLDAAVEFDVGLEERIHVVVREGRTEVGLGPLDDADAAVACDPRIFLGMVAGLASAVKNASRIDGRRSAVKALERAYAASAAARSAVSA